MTKWYPDTPICIGHEGGRGKPTQIDAGYMEGARYTLHGGRGAVVERLQCGGVEDRASSGQTKHRFREGSGVEIDGGWWDGSEGGYTIISPHEPMPGSVETIKYLRRHRRVRSKRRVRGYHHCFYKITPVAPVVQVVNLEFCLCLSPGFEPQVGRTLDFICKNKSQKDSIVESALQRG